MTAEQLKLWREAMGLTQKDAAATLGAKYRTYQRWESAGAPDHIDYACHWLWLRIPTGRPWNH